MDERSRLAGDPGRLYISEVVHKFFLSVDEASTEAAAATAATMQATSARPDPVSINVNILGPATGTGALITNLINPIAMTQYDCPRSVPHCQPATNFMSW